MLPLLVELAERAVDEEEEDELELLFPRTERTTLPLEVLLELRSAAELLFEVVDVPEFVVLRLTVELFFELELEPLRFT